MKCKNCGRDIPENSLFCNWCGERQIKERRKKNEIRVPTPQRLPSGSFRIVLRAGWLEKQKKTPNLTLTTAIDRYIEARNNTLSPSTIRGYRIYQKHRFQSVMKTPIGKINNWQELCNAETKLCSAKTLKNAYAFIRSVLAENGVEPAKVKLPQIVKKEPPWLEPEEIPVFLKAVHGTSCEIPALLALCSLRRSEICALTWDKVDLKKGTITVSGAVVPDENGKFILKDTNKNESSQRIIPILIPQLKETLQAVGDKDKTGAVYKYGPNALIKRINTVCRKSGLPLIGVHGLRHSFASLAYHLGLSQMETMQIGGWSDAKTMQNIYTHLATKDKLDAVNKMEKFFETCTRNAHEKTESLQPQGK